MLGCCSDEINLLCMLEDKVSDVVLDMEIRMARFFVAISGGGGDALSNEHGCYGLSSYMVYLRRYSTHAVPCAHI